MTTLTRRMFIAAGASVAAVGAFLGWRTWRPRPSSQPTPGRTWVVAMARLIRAIGPWSASDADVADDFISRYLSDTRLDRYAQHADTVQALDRRFDSSHIALAGIDLHEYTESERSLITDMARELYATDEVRAYLRGVPPVGSCIGGLQQHAAEPS